MTVAYEHVRQAPTEELSDELMAKSLEDQQVEDRQSHSKGHEDANPANTNNDRFISTEVVNADNIYQKRSATQSNQFAKLLFSSFTRVTGTRHCKSRI